MSVILNIDTSMGTAGVCLSKEGRVLALAESQDPKNHSSWLHPAIRRLLAETGYRPGDLQAVAVTAGPGSYTGLRVGMAAAKGFCYALDVPLIAENTLNMMAFAAREQLPEADLLCPMIDARRMEVFTAVYQKDGVALLPATAMIVEENSFSELLSVHSISFFGDGSYKCKQLITAPKAAFVNPSYHVGYLGKLSFLRYLQKEFTGVVYSEPVYTKDFHSHTKK
ncbi:MAG TPA: tRNA (adenosine(37)-N6)-threonylcarbamoyltransferase complex dimerization subunit type 1 TsaB [Puia sp.]|jgi:tRNA threonylcarbamoyladenosine biosynthesis protein TsaB|nr:tRNA (adenosine(37)-N6)-threonylcarbamoyltransferase complex dimerization subunit type 1 TsaB [Puia sp.]